MSEIVDFLRAQYEEAKRQAEGIRRILPFGPFDGRDVELTSEGQVIIDGHEYPAEQYLEQASEPAPDTAALADLDAKLAIVDLADKTLKYAEGDSEVDHYGALDMAERTLFLFARPFARHPDYQEEWRP